MNEYIIQLSYLSFGFLLRFELIISSSPQFLHLSGFYRGIAIKHFSTICHSPEYPISCSFKVKVFTFPYTRCNIPVCAYTCKPCIWFIQVSNIPPHTHKYYKRNAFVQIFKFLRFYIVSKSYGRLKFYSSLKTICKYLVFNSFFCRFIVVNTNRLMLMWFHVHFYYDMAGIDMSSICRCSLLWSYIPIDTMGWL